MKKLLLILPLLSVISMAQAETDFCAEVLSYGVGPDGQCVEFTNACIPAEYKRVPSCADVEDVNRNTSLEDRLRARFHSKNRLTTLQDETKESPVAKYHRLGRGAYTRGFTGSKDTTATKTGSNRTATVKNYNSIFRQHNLKGGFDRGQKSTGHTNARQRPSFRSRVNTKNTDEKLSSDPKWSATVQNHFKERKYGSNPYSIASQRSAEQRAYRKARAANRRVDVKGRIISNSRRWRPGGNFGSGNLSGDADFLESEADKKSDVIKSLSEE